VRAGGSDPAANPALRRAMQNARAVNMPKDKIQAAIDKAAGLTDTTNYEEVLYEGYGPHGVAILVESATDSPTRTVANVRLAFRKDGGNLGSSGSVAFMFDKFGVFRLKAEGLPRDELELELIDHGLEEMLDAEDEDGNELVVLRCARESFGTLQSALEARRLAVVSSGFEWIPKTTTSVGAEEAAAVLRLVDRLQQDDDVQAVFHNLA
jgi:YebC/PmpR family DNA-binding regulatory protein